MNDIEKAIISLKRLYVKSCKNVNGRLKGGFINKEAPENKAIDLAIKALEKQLNGGWIPVSERLPEVDKYGDINVLVSMDDEFVWATTYVENEGFELWAESGEVIAWQPLPEPYKEEANETNTI